MYLCQVPVHHDVVTPRKEQDLTQVPKCDGERKYNYNIYNYVLKLSFPSE
jgi:hypothetical protein